MLDTIKMIGYRYEEGRTYEVGEDVGKALIRGGWAEAFEAERLVVGVAEHKRRT